MGAPGQFGNTLLLRIVDHEAQDAVLHLLGHGYQHLNDNARQVRKRHPSKFYQCRFDDVKAEDSMEGWPKSNDPAPRRGREAIGYSQFFSNRRPGKRHLTRTTSTPEGPTQARHPDAMVTVDLLRAVSPWAYARKMPLG